MPDFLLLGPFEVREGERLVELRRRKHRALLALLALRAGEPVSADVVIEELWGGNPPKTARDALHNYVSQLRKQLGEGTIETRGNGYLLDGDLDLVRFERLVEEARGAATVEERAAKLREALALWRGPPLADLAYEPFAGAEIERLEELHVVTRADLIDAELELGRHAELVPELETLVAEHPFRERLRGLLMLALYRSGRQADALAAYRDARATLLEELGLEPSTALRELEQAILRQDPGLDVPAVLPSMEERRKTVTVLSAELALPEGTDPERLRESAIRARATVEAHGGTVEARGAGTELLGIFGVPATHEDDALRALRAAAELGEGVRVGVDTGEVLVGHGFVSGEAVPAATRLQRGAAPGEVLVAQATLALCRDAVGVEPADGALRLVAVEEGAREQRFPETPLVGRRAELAALEAAFAEACETGRCRLLTITGEPGIGKTRLARELVETVGDQATTLVGRCAPYGQGVTWLPLAEMLEEAGESLDPILAAAGSPGEVFLGARRVLERLAAERPLVLAFDDLHWAEPTLLDLVEYLGRQAEGPMLGLCLGRPELLDERPALGEGAIRLDPLADADVEELASEADPELRTRVVETAGGNPLFAEQLLAFAQEGGALDAVPPTAEALIAARLDLLEPEDRALLQRAAVAGRLFSRAVLQDLGADAARLPPLQETGLVRRTRSGYRFHHVLVRDVAYASLPKAERAELHEQLADRLDERAEPDELVGYHLEQAFRLREGLGRLDGRARRLAADAGARLGRAGIAAWKRQETPATVGLLSRSTDLLPALDPFRLELLCELGPALRTGDDYPAAETVLAAAIEQAAETGDRRLELRARLELAGVQLVSRPGQTADELLKLAEQGIPVFEAVGDDRSLGRAWRWIAHVQGPIRLRYDASAEAAERALPLLERSGWSTSTCVAELANAAYGGATPVSEGIRRCRKLLAQADLVGEARVDVSLAALEAMRGRFAEARGLLTRAEAVFEEFGQTSVGAALVDPMRARVELLAGEPEAAETALRASCRVLEQLGDTGELATRAAELAHLLVAEGRDEEAEGWCERAIELGPADDLATQLWGRSARVSLLARRGELAQAEALAREAVELAEGTDALNHQARTWLDLAEVLTRAGRTAEAEEAGARGLELYERKGNLSAAQLARERLARLALA